MTTKPRIQSSLMVQISRSSLLAIILVAAIRELLYVLAPESSSLNPVDYLLFAVSLPYLFIAYSYGKAYSRRIVLLLLSISLVVAALGQIQLGHSLDFTTYIKFTFPVTILVLSAGYLLPLRESHIRTIYGLLFLLALAGEIRVFGSQSNVNITEVRHSTAYLLIGVAIVVSVSRISKVPKVLSVAVLIIPLAFINVATAVIALGVFFILELSIFWRLNVAARALLGASVIISVVFTRVDLLNLKAQDLGLLGSGRIAAWEDGINSFFRHGFYDQLLGQGSGSSYQFWGVWWWSQKDIHSDFLRVLIEYGVIVFLVTLAGFLLLYVRLLKIEPTSSSVLASAIAASLISNGVLGRPYAAVLWALAIVVSANASRRKSEEFRDDAAYELQVENLREPSKSRPRWTL